ncbi:MAG: ABC transporter permease subunit [Planctomycetota bacterium]|nr:ABC transporter permease subunit [Planctomycetota bacterium]
MKLGVTVPEFPLFRRELLGLLRTRRAFWLLVTVVTLSGLLPLTAWDAYGWMQAEFNAIVFMIFVETQAVLGVLIIPAFTAGAIAGERERHTWELLYTTYLSPASIALSKAAASATYVLILLLAPVPVACVLFLLGGVAFEAILKSYAVTFAAVVSSALICLTVSMRCERTGPAAIRSVLWVLFWNIGLVLLLWLAGGLLLALLEEFGIRERDIAAYFGSTGSTGRLMEQAFASTFGLSPFLAIGLELSPDPFRTFLPVEVWRVYLVYAGILGGLHLVFLLVRARRPDLGGSGGGVRRRGRRRRGGPVRRSLFTQLLLELGHGGAPLLSTPVFLKEIRTETYGKVWFRRIGFWLPFLLCSSYLALTDDVGELITAAGCTVLALVVLVVPATSAGSIPREIEQGNMDLLRSTLLGPRQVVAGKFMGAVYSGWGIVCAGIWSMLLAAVVHGDSVVKGVVSLLAASSVLVLSLTFTAALTIWCSVISKRTVTALVVCFLVLLLLLAGLPLFLAISGGKELALGVQPFFVLGYSTEAVWHSYVSIDKAMGIYVVFLILNLVGSLALWGFSTTFSENLYYQEPGPYAVKPPPRAQRPEP